jgi:hypothetical protein
MCYIESLTIFDLGKKLKGEEDELDFSFASETGSYLIIG